MIKKLNWEKCLALFYKIRILFYVLIPFLLLVAPGFYHLLFQPFLQDYFFEKAPDIWFMCMDKYHIFNNIFTNLLAILDGRYKIQHLGNIITLDNAISTAVLGLAFYFFNYKLIDKKYYLNVSLRHFLSLFFILFVFISELLFLPLFIVYILSLSGKRINNTLLKIVRAVHLAVFSVIFTVLIANTAQEKDYKLMRKIIPGEKYGLALSQKYSMLFVFDGRDMDKAEIIAVDLNNNQQQKVVYRNSSDGKNLDVLDIWLKANDSRDELYIINRTLRRLLIIDLKTYKIKKTIFAEEFGFISAQCNMVYNEKYLFINEELHLSIFKIDLDKQAIIERKIIKSDSVAPWSAYNRSKNLIYIGDLCDLKEPQNNYLYAIDPGKIAVMKKIKVPGSIYGIAISQDGNKIYCILPFEGLFSSAVYIFNANNYRLEKRIKVPYGSRTIALDERRNILFCGSALSGIITGINLDNNENVKFYKAHNSLRQISIDPIRKKIYAATQMHGLFETAY